MVFAIGHLVRLCAESSGLVGLEYLLRVVDWLLHCDRMKVVGLVGLVGYE